MKHITKNRPQMVSITKLYLILRKKLLFVSVLPIEKARSSRITLGITDEFYALFFAGKQTSILTLQFSVLLLCIRQQIKGEQSDEIRHSFLINSKPHEVKSTDIHCILTTNININRKCRGEKTTRRKECQIIASAMYSSYQAGVSTEGGLEVGQTL